MPDRSSKLRRLRDVNRPSQMIGEMAAGDTKDQPADQNKNPHAVALGRLGGQKGGKARAEALTPERRRDIAAKAAAARWRKPKP